MIGHTTARTLLEAQLPVATLLRGPRSVGKWTLARHLAAHHRVTAADRWEVNHGLTIDTVRLITAFTARHPIGAFKLVIARIDESNNAAINALLKTLEEPPPRVKFLLTSSSRTLPTVASRCEIYDLGLLTYAELEDIYRAQGFPTVKAQRAAAYARGQVRRGFEAENKDNHRNQIINLAKALATGDKDLFTAVFSTWDGHCSELLTTFFTECLTHRWNTFREADSFGLHTDRTRLWRMVAAVSRLPFARPRLAVRSALEPFIAR